MDKKNELMQKLLNYWFVMDKLNQNAHPADEVRKHYKKVKKLEQELNRGKKTSQEETLSKTIIVHTAVRREQLNDISTIIENELAFFDRYSSRDTYMKQATGYLSSSVRSRVRICLQSCRQS